MRLFRPVGVAELELIRESGFAAFPPRLDHQPIFYPVLDEAYADQIARDWNTKDPASGFAGFVTAFELEDDYVGRFRVETVGKSSHRELWVPAEELSDFNSHLEGPIEVLRHFVGAAYTGSIDPNTHLPLERELPESGSGFWSVMRLDDNGNEFAVADGLHLEQALHTVSEFEARGHKQTFWARLSPVDAQRGAPEGSD